MGDQPVQINFSLLAYFQFLSASPILKVGLVGFLFVADGLTHTGIILLEELAYLYLREFWRDGCSSLFYRRRSATLFWFTSSYIGCRCMLGFMRLPLHHHDPP